MPAVMDELQQRMTDRRLVTGIPSGLVALDELTRGFQKKDLVVIGAQTSTGKSSLALNVAEYAALKDGRRIAVFALEMDRLSIGMRLLASQARIRYSYLVTGFVPDREWGPLSSAMGRLAESGIYIDDASELTVADVRARARRLREDGGLDLVIIDYLQLMRGTQRAENKNLEVAEISRALKTNREGSRCPGVVTLAALARSVTAEQSPSTTLRPAG
jgi:replicative DNA helicase